MSIASLILGIIGMIFSCVLIGVIPCFVGLVLGIVALATKRPKNKTAVAGIIVSGIGILLFVVTLSIILDPEAQTEESSDEVKKEKVYLTEEEIPQLFSDPEQFEGKYVVLTGKIFTEPDDSGDYIGLQIWNKPEESENNFYVVAPKDGTEYESDAYVIVDGLVDGEMSGRNLVGGKVTAPLIIADKVEISTYKDVARPTIKEYSFEDLKWEKYGYSVSITKIEIAEQETRVYLTVKNGGESEFQLFEHETKIVQNGKQYETEVNYDADYPELQTDLLPGTESSGVLVFRNIEPDANFQIYMDVYSENWDEELEPFKLDITVQEK